jgi:hypothetical protein
VKKTILGHGNLGMCICADHYQGITENWSAGTIYCSEVTRRLVIHLLDVKEEYVTALPMDQPLDIQGEQSQAVAFNFVWPLLLLDCDNLVNGVLRWDIDGEQFQATAFQFLTCAVFRL